MVIQWINSIWKFITTRIKMWTLTPRESQVILELLMWYGTISYLKYESGHTQRYEARESSGKSALNGNLHYVKPYARDGHFAE